MAHTRNRLPDNTSIVMPRLVCRDAAAEMAFCMRTFEAEELNRRPGPDGAVAHGLLRIGGEMIMIEGEWPSLPSRAPILDGTSPVVIFVYVPDVDATLERALENGARELVPLQDQFWGDRIAWFMDPAGHVWTIASRIEDTTADERTARWRNILGDETAMAMPRTFTTTIVRDGAMCIVPLTFDPRSAFGKVRVPVKVTLNGYTYRSTIASMAGQPFVPLRRSHREAAGLEGGETIEVRIERDTEERAIEPPSDLVDALKAMPQAWDGWSTLSYSHQREHVEAVEAARTPQTRARRIARAVDAIGRMSPRKRRP